MGYYMKYKHTQMLWSRYPTITALIGPRNKTLVVFV